MGDGEGERETRSISISFVACTPLRDAPSSKTFASRLVRLTEFFRSGIETGSCTFSPRSPTRPARSYLHPLLPASVGHEKPANGPFRSVVCLTKRSADKLDISFCQRTERRGKTLLALLILFTVATKARQEVQRGGEGID